MPEPQTWNVRRTGVGDVISWNGKPLHFRINWQHFSSTQRATINDAIADVCPRVGSGFTNDGQTEQKPASGQAVWLEEQGATDLFVYAQSTNWGGPPGAQAWADTHWIGDEYKGAIVIFNANFFNQGYPPEVYDFKKIAYHEMGHAVGLLHPTSGTQVMSSSPAALPWKSGDLAGFTTLKGAH
jgi:hypothetical protein